MTRATIASQLGGAHDAAGGGQSPAINESGRPVVHTRHDGDAVIVVVAGEFDLVTANPVREALTHAIAERRPQVIIDLNDVTFVDSSGVHVILEAYSLCRDAESTLTIRHGPRNVQRVFELTNLRRCLPFEISD